MRAGKLRNLVRIEQAGETEPDEHGHRSAAWEPVDQAWVDILGLAGTQIERGPMIDAETSHRIEIRFRTDLTPKMRVVHGADVYNINSIVDPDRRRVRLFLFCSLRLA